MLSPIEVDDRNAANQFDAWTSVHSERGRRKALAVQ
jgi:hypothetical protein